MIVLQSNWLELVAGARKCRPEYVLLSMLPTISALCGPETKLEISQGFHEEKLNLYLCILGESGANKSSSYGLSNAVLKSIPETEQVLLDSNWSKSGLLGHLKETKGVCLLAYEEMDPFFSNIMKMEKQGVSERTFFCELYDGRPQSVTRSTNDGKVQRQVIGETSMNIVGYHQPEPFLKDYYELSLRRDGFMERFLVCCPRSLRPSQEEVKKFRETLNETYTPSMRDLKGIYTRIHEIFKDGGQTLILSPDARAEYEQIAAEENEDYNRNLERKMEEAKDGEGSREENSEMQLETKFVRSVLKISAALHVLEETFRIVQELTCTPATISTNISSTTFKRARALALYFTAQRNILFKAISSEERVTQPRSLENQILMSDGKVLVKNKFRMTFNIANRPELDKLTNMIGTLEADGYGKYVKEGKFEGFLKTPNISEEKASKYGISVEDYGRQLCKQCPKMKESTKAVFERLYAAAFPPTL